MEILIVVVHYVSGKMFSKMVAKCLCGKMFSNMCWKGKFSESLDNIGFH